MSKSSKIRYVMDERGELPDGVVQEFKEAGYVVEQVQGPLGLACHLFNNRHDDSCVAVIAPLELGDTHMSGFELLQSIAEDQLGMVPILIANEPNRNLRLEAQQAGITVLDQNDLGTDKIVAAIKDQLTAETRNKSGMTLDQN